MQISTQIYVTFTITYCISKTQHRIRSSERVFNSTGTQKYPKRMEFAPIYYYCHDLRCDLLTPNDFGQKFSNKNIGAIKLFVQ